VTGRGHGLKYKCFHRARGKHDAIY